VILEPVVVERVLGADQREAEGLAFAFALPPFPHLRKVFGTARSRQGRAVLARRSGPLTARTVPEGRTGGKGGRGSQGVSPWRGSGAAPRAPHRARRLRAASRKHPILAHVSFRRTALASVCRITNSSPAPLSVPPCFHSHSRGIRREKLVRRVRCQLWFGGPGLLSLHRLPPSGWRPKAGLPRPRSHPDLGLDKVSWVANSLPPFRKFSLGRF